MSDMTYLIAPNDPEALLQAISEAEAGDTIQIPPGHYDGIAVSRQAKHGVTLLIKHEVMSDWWVTPDAEAPDTSTPR